jgi:hypothetical protein
MSEPVHVTRALLVALLEEIGDDDPCGRAIIETALEFGDALYKLSFVAESWGLSSSIDASAVCDKYGWEVAP